MIYTTVQKTWDLKMVMKEVSSAHQACIHMIKKYSKICNIVKYYYYLK